MARKFYSVTPLNQMASGFAAAQNTVFFSSESPNQQITKTQVIQELSNFAGAKNGYTIVDIEGQIKTSTSEVDNVRGLTSRIVIHWDNYVTITSKNRSAEPVGGFQSFVNKIDLSESSGNLTIQYWRSNADVYYITINTNTRKIVDLFLKSFYFDFAPQGIIYHIETDDGISITANPLPQQSEPEPTEAVEVPGIKISELSSTSNLLDNDLLVISRDEQNDGAYDNSYKVSFDRISEQFRSDIVFFETPIQVLSRSSAMSETEFSLDVPSAARFVILQSYWSVGGPDTGTTSYIYVNGQYVLAAIMAAGDGDYISGANQGMFPVSNSKITLRVTASFNGGSNVSLLGYIL